MSKSNITVTIYHNGEYCGKCRFLGNKIDGIYWCKAFDNTDLWSCRDTVKRCDKCIRQTVPVKEKERHEDL